MRSICQARRHVLTCHSQTSSLFPISFTKSVGITSHLIHDISSMTERCLQTVIIDIFHSTAILTRCVIHSHNSSIYAAFRIQTKNLKTLERTFRFIIHSDRIFKILISNISNVVIF